MLVEDRRRRCASCWPKNESAQHRFDYSRTQPLHSPRSRNSSSWLYPIQRRSCDFCISTILPVYCREGDSMRRIIRQRRISLHDNSQHRHSRSTKAETDPLRSVWSHSRLCSVLLRLLSPMLFQLKTGRVAGYTEGQEPLIYLVIHCTGRARSGAGLSSPMAMGLPPSRPGTATWPISTRSIGPWSISGTGRTISTTWTATRKQAEFLVHRFCDWSLIQEIGVVNTNMKTRVEHILGDSTPGCTAGGRSPAAGIINMEG